MKLTETKTLTGNWYIVNKFAVRDKMISLKRGTENQGMGTGNGERGTGNGESLKAGIFKMGNL